MFVLQQLVCLEHSDIIFPTLLVAVRMIRPVTLQWTNCAIAVLIHYCTFLFSLAITKVTTRMAIGVAAHVASSHIMVNLLTIIFCLVDWHFKIAWLSYHLRIVVDCFKLRIYILLEASWIIKLLLGFILHDGQIPSFACHLPCHTQATSFKTSDLQE